MGDRDAMKHLNFKLFILVFGKNKDANASQQQ